MQEVYLMSNFTPEDGNMDAVLTPDQIACRLNFTSRTITKWLRDGYLKGFKLNGKWRMRKSDLDRFIADPPKYPDKQK